MTILNMTYGQGNPYQPFHLNGISDLSATPGNAEATIKWTDPGNLVVDGQTLATWDSTKLVRKVGSAPSDSSDGTLVVTETVADTYSSNGYTDTGLTNGTTYYYAAFAVADNGTEIISNVVNETPLSPRQPGINTIAYYPLTATTTVNDESGNNYTLTNNGTVFGTYQGVSCAYFNNNPSSGLGLYTTAFGLQTNMTLGLWFYQISFPNYHSCQFQFGSGTRGQVLGTWINQSGDVCLGAWGSPESIVYKGTYQGAWHWMCMTKSGTSCILYIDNTQITSLTFNLSIPQRLNLGDQPVDNSDLYGYLSNIIVEDKVWTQQERENYFNITKGEYGIS